MEQCVDCNSSEVLLYTDCDLCGPVYQCDECRKIHEGALQIERQMIAQIIPVEKIKEKYAPQRHEMSCEWWFGYRCTCQ